VLRGTRIIIPSKMQPRTLALADEGHLGVVGTKQNLRSKVWWPGMDKRLRDIAERAIGVSWWHGQIHLNLFDPPHNGPWQDLAVDLMGPLLSGHSLLVIV